MQERILQYINQNHMIDKGDHIIIGVSGGADSVCLFHILRQLQGAGSFTIAVVHVNHGLRGDEADADEEFTKQLCRQYDIPYQSVTFDVKAEAQKRGMSLEEAGRIVRRETFKRLAKECGATKIALGHHQDDQVETVIFNLVRGSALSGLCGIHPVRGQYIRPLLCISKIEIEDYLTSHNLSWRIDETNLTCDYTRNKIRHSVVQSLAEINPKAQEHIASLAKHLQEVEAYLSEQTKMAYNHHTEQTKAGIVIAASLTEEDSVIQANVMRKCVRELTGSLKDLSKDNIARMVGIFDKEVSKRTDIGNGLVIRRTYEGAILEKETKADEKAKRTEVLVAIPGRCQWSEETFICQVKEYDGRAITEELYTKWLDYDKIKGDLVLRNRRSGDVIAICQDGGKKKLKGYFIDAKIPCNERDEMVLLATGSEILWIVGDRISEKYKVSQATKKILVISKKERDWHE